MAVTDVTVTVSSLPLKPIGVQINYGVNAIPVCLIEMDPTDSTILNDPDAYKRKEVITVTCKVKGRPDLLFRGYFDGISISQTMGGISYNAVLKGRQQLLLEADTTVPGLNPYGVNPFKPISAFQVDAGQDSGFTFTSIGVGDLQTNLSNTSIAEVYKQIAIMSLKYQTSPENYASMVPVNDDLQYTPLTQVIGNLGRSQKLQDTLQLLENDFDVSSLNSLTNLVDVQQQSIVTNLVDQFLKGSHNMWENLLGYYSTLGAILIPSNNKVFVVPNNGFITFPHSTVGQGQQSSIINAAYPADYTGFQYNDNGYRDVGYVAVVSQLQPAPGTGIVLPSYQGGYPKQGQNSLSPGSALLVVDANPLIYAASTKFNNPVTYAPQAKNHTPNKTANMTATTGATPFDGAPTSDTAEVSEQVNQDYHNLLQAIGDNYAEIKFYQARYGDRMGSITNIWNPNWVPGTVGTLYTRQPSSLYLDYFVQSVSHRINLAAPNSGTATTTINFNCGRFGQNPVSVASDQLYNYSYSDVQGIQNQFVSDITS